jgi:short-subunit dehydrogenase
MPDPDLKRRFGPAALITGASDGIGRACARQLAAAGLDLVLVARRQSLLHDLAHELQTRHGVQVQVIPADLGAPGAVAQIMGQIEAEIGLLVAAAGFGSAGAFLDQDPASEANMVDVNCRSVIELTHACAAPMAARRRGGIMLFSSLVGFQGAPWSATYAATKGFVQGLAEALAIELAPSGVAVLSVAPGPVNTGFGARAGMVMGAAARPEDVARAALAALGRRHTTRPGGLAKALGWSLGLLPRWGRVRVMGLIMRGMARRDTAPTPPEK